MNSRKIDQYEVLTFDCYGTLIDWETGIWDALQSLLIDNGVGHIDRRAGLGAFAEIENALEREVPDRRYCDMLRITHRQIAERFGLRSTDVLDQAFADAIAHWPAFDDSA